MRVAVLSDTHGNLAAVEAVLADAASAQVDAVWNLGDLVDYGPQPNETMDLLRAEATLHLAGNHDLLLTGRLPLEDFSKTAQDCYFWSRDHVAPRHQEWLATLEPSRLLDGGVELYHGSPMDPAWGYLDTKVLADDALSLRPEAKLVFVGHAHRQGAWRERADVDDKRVRDFQFRPNQPFALEGHRWVMNVGSVGFPNETREDRRAGYLLLDFDAHTAELRRVDYDRAATRAAYAGLGLPARLERDV
jgi:predicted phosphodiesterase